MRDSGSFGEPVRNRGLSYPHLQCDEQDPPAHSGVEKPSAVEHLWVVYLDAIHFKVKLDGHIINKAANMAISIDLYGKKDILGMWFGENESAKFWLNVLNEL